MTDLTPLVTLAAGGDRAAFARLVEETSGVVCAIALAEVKDLAASQDVAQDVFLAAWTGLARLRKTQSFLPWLRQVTRHRARTWVRRRPRGSDDKLAELADGLPSAETRLLDAEQRRALDTAWSALAADSREILTLYYREGESTAHVAMLLGLREAAVRQRLARARATLRTEVLALLGGVLKQSAPGAAFTTAVVTLTSAGPSSAAAAGAGLSAQGSSALLKASGILGGAGLGAGLGITAVWLGLRRHLRDAKDERERAALRRFASTAMLVALAAALGFALAGWLALPALRVATQLGFGAAMAALYWVKLPQITGRRHGMKWKIVFVLAVAGSSASMIWNMVQRGWM